jgi:hypothetical protein
VIISEGYAKRLIREGDADRVGWTAYDASRCIYYAIINRNDIRRTDHYQVRSNSREFLLMMGAMK